MPELEGSTRRCAALFSGWDEGWKVFVHWTILTVGPASIELLMLAAG